MKKCRDNLRLIAGATLIEMAFTVFIAAIAITGMVVAYSGGIEMWKKSTEQMILYDEGSSALSLIDRFVRRANYITVKSYAGHANAMLEMRCPVRTPRGIMDDRVVQFYFLSFDKTLRWNDLTGPQGVFNQKLLPLVTFRRQENSDPYLNVRYVTFTPIDPIRPNNPTTDGYALIKIDLVMDAVRGDSLHLSTVICKRNTPD